MQKRVMIGWATVVAVCGFFATTGCGDGGGGGEDGGASATPLTVGAGATTGSAEAGAATAYSFSADGSASYIITVRVTTGDPNLYVCESLPCDASVASPLASSTAIGVDDTVRLRTPAAGTIYLGIVGFGGPATYSVEISTGIEIWVMTYDNGSTTQTTAADTLITGFDSLQVGGLLATFGSDDGGDGGGGFSGASELLASGETYFVEVRPLTTGRYSIEANTTGFVAGPSAGQPADDANEGNDSSARATPLTLGTASDNALPPGDIADWFSFVVP